MTVIVSSRTFRTGCIPSPDPDVYVLMNETGSHEERLARQFTELFTANYGPWPPGRA